jgi:hypothetical protein
MVLHTENMPENSYGRSSDGDLKHLLVDYFNDYQVIGASSTRRLVAIKETNVVTRELVAFFAAEWCR